MPAPQAFFYFNGIQSLLSASFTLGHGVTPSIVTMTIPRQHTPLPRVGTVTIQFGSEAPIVFPDCKVLSCDFSISSSGEERWGLQIADTRWRWEGGYISGEYNVRNDDQSVRPETRSTTHNLLALLFQAMGVAKFDVSQVPQGTFPECIWEAARPHQELGALVDRLGCTVVLGPFNVIKVCRAGFGAVLPVNDRLIDLQATVEALDVPESLVNVGGRLVYQLDLECEAVGLEPDGTIRRIGELSYKPAEGWANFDVAIGNVAGKKNRELALQSVFRMYRVRTPFDCFGDQVEDLRRILPMTDRQILTNTILGVVENKQAQLYGLFASGGSGYRNNLEEAIFKAEAGGAVLPLPKITGDLEKNPAEEWTRSFSLDTERGIVTLGEPAYLYKHEEVAAGPGLPALTNYLREQATLYLRTSFYLRDVATRGWNHYKRVRPLNGPKQGAKPKNVFHADVVFKQWKVGKPGAPGVLAKNNEEEAKAMADFYLDAEQTRIEGSDPQSATYAGYPTIFPDGAVRQITYSLSEDGAPTTRVSRNREEASAAITYEQRRHEERVVRLIEGDAKKEKPRGGK